MTRSGRNTCVRYLDNWFYSRVPGSRGCRPEFCGADFVLHRVFGAGDVGVAVQSTPLAKPFFLQEVTSAECACGLAQWPHVKRTC